MGETRPEQYSNVPFLFCISVILNHLPEHLTTQRHVICQYGSSQALEHFNIRKWNVKYYNKRTQGAEAVSCVMKYNFHFNINLMAMQSKRVEINELYK